MTNTPQIVHVKWYLRDDEIQNVGSSILQAGKLLFALKNSLHLLDVYHIIQHPVLVRTPCTHPVGFLANWVGVWDQRGRIQILEPILAQEVFNSIGAFEDNRGLVRAL